jgi:hypothetical protein
MYVNRPTDRLEEALERKVYQPLFGNVDVISRRKHLRSSFGTIIEIKYMVHENADEAIAAHLAGIALEGLSVSEW